MSTWDALAGLPVEIEDYALEPLQATVSSDFERKSTVIHLRGAGRGGARRGRDLRRGRSGDPAGGRARRCRSAGSFTLASFCERLAELDAVPRAAPARGLGPLPHLGL